MEVNFGCGGDSAYLLQCSIQQLDQLRKRRPVDWMTKGVFKSRIEKR
jgi:hypothetical protein